MNKSTIWKLANGTVAAATGVGIGYAMNSKTAAVLCAADVAWIASQNSVALDLMLSEATTGDILKDAAMGAGLRVVTTAIIAGGVNAICGDYSKKSEPEDLESSTSAWC